MSVRPWYHRPEWIGLAVTGIIAAAGAVGAFSQGAAQTAQNTKDIAEIKGQIGAMPERLARIEQKVDDLTQIEKRRRGASGD